MKSIKYQQFRTSTPSSPRCTTQRTQSTFRETAASLFQNYDLPIVSDKSFLNSPVHSRASNSPKKQKQFQQLYVENPFFKSPKRERSFSNSERIYSSHDRKRQQSMHTNQSVLMTAVSPSNERNEFVIPVRMMYDTTQQSNGSVIYGYPSFHSSLRQKKKIPPKTNNLHLYKEIMQLDVIEKMKRYNESLKQKSDKTNSNNKNKGIFEISIFNYSNIGRNEIHNLPHHQRQLNVHPNKSIK